MLKARQRKGFTLAEVLITLGIIGVVAAMTIPTLFNSMQNKELEVAFKKSYSTLSQAITTMKAEEGPIWATYNYRNNNARAGWTLTSFHSALMKYFKGIKDCGDGSTNCIASDSYYRNYTNTVDYDAEGFDQREFYTSDGMLFAPVILSGATQQDYIYIYVDVNGPSKKPNKVGYDMFRFEVTSSDMLVPEGAPNTYYNWAINLHCDLADVSNDSGSTCGAHAITKSDYFKKLP